MEPFDKENKYKQDNRLYFVRGTQKASKDLRLQMKSIWVTSMHRPSLALLDLETLKEKLKMTGTLLGCFTNPYSSILLDYNTFSKDVQLHCRHTIENGVTPIVG